VTAEQVPSAQEKQLRMQRLWEVTPTINIGATPPIPAASVVTQTQSVVTPGMQYLTPPAGTNGFAMIQPYPLPLSPQGYAMNGGMMPAYSNMMGSMGFNMPAANMPSAPAPMVASACGAPDLPPCAQGVVVTGSSAVAVAPYPGYAQWMQPPPIQYAQPAPPPVYTNTVTSSITSTSQAAPASVTQVQTVDQPWAAMSNLPAETNIIEDETEIPDNVDPNKFHVHVEGLPTGCSASGGAEEWEGELNVEEVKCPGGAPEPVGDASLGGWERGDYVGGWD